MPANPADLRFFLGGQDLEMATIRQLLEQHAPHQFADDGLAWGAKASAYRHRIQQSLCAGKTVVLVELADDLQLSSGGYGAQVIDVDHHGTLAGRDHPTALEQVFALLQLPDSMWNRSLQLVAANDRGHVRAMLELQATRDELLAIRAADRAAQGITPDEERIGREAAIRAESLCDGRLTLVTLPHRRTATVTDALDIHLGGPGYENLLVLCPSEVMFYGNGRVIHVLNAAFPGGFYGGELPVHGFWGLPVNGDRSQLLSVLMPTMSRLE